jgi:hypothetical protein
MNKREFTNLLFRIEELLLEVDYYRRKINDCRVCKGWDEEDLEGMCLFCLRALQEEFEAIKKVAKNEEFNRLMRTIKKALQKEDTGELAEITALSRLATMK